MPKFYFISYIKILWSHILECCFISVTTFSMSYLLLKSRKIMKDMILENQGGITYRDENSKYMTGYFAPKLIPFKLPAYWYVKSSIFARGWLPLRTSQSLLSTFTHSSLWLTLSILLSFIWFLICICLCSCTRHFRLFFWFPIFTDSPLLVSIS